MSTQPPGQPQQTPPTPGADPAELKHTSAGWMRAFQHLGALLVPAGVVTTVCQCFSCSTQVTGIFAGFALLAAAPLLFRPWIDRHIRGSTAVIIAIIIFAAIVGGAMLVVGGDYNTLHNTGLERYYPQSADIHPEIGLRIAKVQNEVWFCGVDFHVSAADRKTELLERLKNGVRVNYLVLDPLAEDFEKLSKDMGENTPKLLSECIDGIKALLDIQARWSEQDPTATNKGQLEIRFFDNFPRYRFYIFDPYSENASICVIPYITSIEATSAPAFFFRKTPGGVFPAYFGSAKNLWTHGKTFDSWLKEHPTWDQTPIGNAGKNPAAPAATAP